MKPYIRSLVAVAVLCYIIFVWNLIFEFVKNAVCC
jgi:hypothetical protein